MSDSGRLPLPVREITTRAALMAAGDGSAFLRHEFPDPLEAAGWVLAAAVAAPRRTHVRPRGLVVLGDPADAARLTSWIIERALVPGDGPVSVTVARAAASAVTPRLAQAPGWTVTRVSQWEWMCLTSPPPLHPSESDLTPLDESARAEIESVLARANPGTDAQPFVRPGQHWIGARDAFGDLVACGMVEPSTSGQPVIEGITVLPGARGRGLGGGVTAYLTRYAVRRHGVCTLGLYSDNAAARRTYTALGYGDVHAWTSHRLERVG